MTNIEAGMAVATSPSQANDLNFSSPTAVRIPLSSPACGS